MRLFAAVLFVVAEVNSELFEYFADFGVVPKFGVYPRVSAQSLYHFRERLFAGFPYSLSSFVYERKQDSPSFLRRYQKRH